MNSFSDGDVVTLKSGGPAMTILETRGGSALCMWFDANHQLQNSMISQSVLTRVAPPSGPAMTPKQAVGTGRVLTGAKRKAGY